MSPEAIAPPSPGTDVLLLSCMDFRMLTAIARYMDRRGWTDRFDHLILAGASLGASSERFPAWRQTFWDHLQLAIDLHGIHTVVLLDHRDCGAYRQILGDEHTRDPDIEERTHGEVLQGLAGRIRERHPQLTVETLLMDLSGGVTVIS